MAPHGKELTKEQKEIVIYFSNNGFSSFKIPEFTNINSRTIQKFLKWVNERGTTENKQRRGSKKKQHLDKSEFYLDVWKATDDKH